MNDYFITGVNHNEVHVPGPRIQDPAFPGDPTKTIAGPSKRVAEVTFAEGINAANAAQHFAESLNLVELFDTLFAQLPPGVRNAPDGVALEGKLDQLRAIPKPR